VTEPNDERHQAQEPWTTDRFAAEATDAIAAMLSGDVDRLMGLADTFREAASRDAYGSRAPINPWQDPAVVYGALLGLAELTELASRAVVPPKIFRQLLASSEARRILLTIAAQPGGMINKSAIPELTGIHRSNAHGTLAKLMHLGLIERYGVNVKGTVMTFEVTSLGWAAVEALRSWGMREDTDRATNPFAWVKAGFSQKLQERRLFGAPEKLEAGRAIGKSLTGERGERQAALAAAAQGIERLETQESAELILGMVEGIKEQEGVARTTFVCEFVERNVGRDVTERFEGLLKVLESDATVQLAYKVQERCDREPQVRQAVVDLLLKECSAVGGYKFLRPGGTHPE
jgi:DNA-binding MarR family transcriptional regulator